MNIHNILIFGNLMLPGIANMRFIGISTIKEKYLGLYNSLLTIVAYITVMK